MSKVSNIFELLVDAACAHGESVAVDFRGSTIRYIDLLERAERMATTLQSVGAQPGTRVAHAFTKSIDALVTLFAIARTGAAYVPIDPAWPTDRIMAVCEDAGIAIWTGSKPPATDIASLMRSMYVSNTLESGAATIEAAIDAPRISDVIPAPERGIANLLFTSGSTGRPKGVEITTLSLDHFSRWSADYFELTPSDRVANHAPYNFDLSTFDIFSAVRAGATMCPVPERVKMFPYQLATFVAQERISVWYSVPSALVMMQLRGQLPEHDLSALRHIIFAGEVMPMPALTSLMAMIPHATWTNLYGPTETNVCTYYSVRQKDTLTESPLPIGRPISDTRVWIVGPDGLEVADGESGELLVAGPTITTGYSNDAALTRERLAAVPDGDGLAYRTGDRVRRRADGELMFEGRIDRMIKCRGHRIEPGEIETALFGHPSIREAAVIAIPDPIFGNRLRACVVFRDGATATQADLIAHCRANVPTYMIPDEWDIRDAMPQTDRGKVDLRALAASE